MAVQTLIKLILVPIACAREVPFGVACRLDSCRSLGMFWAVQVRAQVRGADVRRRQSEVENLLG